MYYSKETEMDLVHTFQSFCCCNDDVNLHLPCMNASSFFNLKILHIFVQLTNANSDDLPYHRAETDYAAKTAQDPTSSTPKVSN